MKLINIGFGNLVNAQRIIAVVAPDSSPIKRIVAQAKADGELIDASQGRATKAVIITDSGHIVLSYLSAEALQGRIAEEKSAEGYTQI